MARSLNRVQLIGNLTRDPELRYTPSGTAVCTFGLATNRSWTTDTGDKHDETEFHKIVAWNKLAELCSQFLTKGRKVYVEGRLSTRKWTAQDGTARTSVEVVIDDMILLDNRRGTEEPARTSEDEEMPEATDEVSQAPVAAAKAKPQKEPAKKEEPKKEDEEEPMVTPEDIPF